MSFFSRLLGRKAPPRLSGLVDLHLHLLPAVDDGALNVAQSMEMARALVLAGFDTVVATPHHRESAWKVNRRVVLDKVGELNLALERNDIPLKVLPGNEVYLDADFQKDLDRKQFATMADADRHVLMEFPESGVVFGIPELSFELQTRGIVPIIAHPERYVAVQDRPETAREWVEAGCLLQLDLGSLVGASGAPARKVAKKMLKQELFDLAATDLHSPTEGEYSPTSLVNELVRQSGAEKALLLLSTNPRIIASGRQLTR